MRVAKLPLSARRLGCCLKVLSQAPRWLCLGLVSCGTSTDGDVSETPAQETLPQDDDTDAVCEINCDTSTDGGVSETPAQETLPEDDEIDAVCESGATRICVGAGACEGGQFCENRQWSRCDWGDPGSPNAPSSSGPSHDPGAGGSTGNDADAGGTFNLADAERVSLLGDETGCVDIPSLGIQAQWGFSCQSSCSTDVMPPHAEPVIADEAGAYCMRGTWDEVRISGSDIWDVGMGFFLNLYYKRSRPERSFYDAAAHGVLGISLDVEWRSPLARTLYVMLVSETGHSLLALEFPGPETIHVESSWQQFYPWDVGEDGPGFNPELAYGIVVMDGSPEAESGDAFDFCISNVEFLVKP